jgi:hypothetical protein
MGGLHQEKLDSITCIKHAIESQGRFLPSASVVGFELARRPEENGKIG